jgi:very-short-patch-repair endonuclease
MGADRDPDRVVDRIARAQHGAFSRAQASAAGFSRTMIDRRTGSGAWARLAPRVYALTSHPYSWERQAMAATLSVTGALLSGQPAAALHGIDGFRRGRLEITAPPGSNDRSRLAAVRRSSFVDATHVAGIPVLTLVDTLLSLAGRVSFDALDRAVDTVLARQPSLRSRLEDRFLAFAADRRRGTVPMRRILLARGVGYTPPTSELERRLRSVLDVATLPPFDYEVGMPWWPAGTGRVDAYSQVCRLIVEADGRAWHTRERHFVTDRRRDNLAAANGHAVLRFTWDDLVGDVSGTRALVRDTARSRGWPPADGSSA